MTDPREPLRATLDGILAKPAAEQPLTRQIYLGIRAAIASGRLEPDVRLPSTRALAKQWGVARSTVVAAFEQLNFEGYLGTRAGSGTFVRSSPGRGHGPSGPAEQSAAPAPPISRRGRRLVDHYELRRSLVDTPLPFRPGIPAHGSFPTTLWRRLASRRWQQLSNDDRLGFESQGVDELRAVLADHLLATRGIRCEVDQIFMVSSSQQALALAAQVTLDPGDPVWIEDPGYPRARAALAASGAQLTPVPVDDEGLSIEAGLERCPRPRLIYTTPSHQYPLGRSMPRARRVALADLARSVGGWIVEDDYLNELRYAGRPLDALHSIDDGCVLYLGTFSKVFSPALRIGYLIVPRPLVAAFRAARALVDRAPSFIDQATLADFIGGGHLARHIRRMRRTYTERRDALHAYLTERADGLLAIEPPGAGLHLVARLPAEVSDEVVARSLAAIGIVAPPLSYYGIEPVRPGGLLLGFAGWSPDELTLAAERLIETVATVCEGSSP